jgi:hypothetical protein
MDAEFKKGDEVYYKQDLVDDGKRQKYKVTKVEQVDVPADAKRLMNEQPNGTLYGKEIEKISQPALSLTIEPTGGGRTLKVSQGEIELIR